MAIIVAPDLLVGNFKWVSEKNDIESRSMFAAQVIQIGEPTWRVSFQTVRSPTRIASTVESLIDELDGKKNQLAMYNVAIPAPQGTLRGVNSLHAVALQGATSVTFNSSSPVGSTLLKGDLIGFGTGYSQQVVRVTAPAVVDSNGRMTVSFYPRLRNLLPVNAAVIWDKPRALFRQETISSGVNYLPGLSGEGASFDLRESWTP